MPQTTRQADPAARDPLSGKKWRLSAVLYAALLLVILVLAAVARFRLPQTPFFDADYGGYLRPALSALTGHRFAHVDGRDSLYPAFIFAVLKLCGDFRAISVIQHLLGLATGILMAAVCRRGMRLLRAPAGAGRPGFWPILRLLPVAAYLSAPSAILFEQSIRPEAIFPFFAVFSIWLNVAFIRRRWILPNAGQAAWLGAAQGVVSLMAYKLKPSFGLALPLINLPVLVSLASSGVSVRSKVMMTAGGAAFCVLFLLWPENVLKKSDPETYTFLPETLFTIHGDQIRQQIAADLQANRASPFPRATVQALLDRLDTALPASRLPENHPYPSLGFNPDYLLYTDPVFHGLCGKQSEAAKLRANIGYYYYARTFLHHPARMLSKIAAQMHIFYHFGAAGHSPLFGKNGRLRGDRLTRVQEGYQRNVDLYTDLPAGNPFDVYAPGRAFIAASRTLTQQPLTIEQAPALTFVRRLWEALYLPGLLAALVMAGWVVGTGRLLAGWLWPVAVTLLVLSYNFGNNLTIAVVHSLDVGRYVDNELAYTLLGATFSLMLLGETARRLTREWLLRPAAEMDAAGCWLTPTALPTLAHATVPPSLCCLIGGVAEGMNPAETAAEYRALFSGATIVTLDLALGDPSMARTRAVLKALTEISSDAVILVDGSALYPAEGAHQLFEAFCQQPADLILGVRSRTDATAASVFMAFVCGWSAADLPAGPRLISRRFLENVPLLAHGLEPELELTLQAIGQGFGVRALTVPFAPGAQAPPPTHHRVIDAKRRFRLLPVLALDVRPLRCASMLAGVFFVLGLCAAVAAQQMRAASRQAAHVPWVVWLAGGLLLLACLTLQTGILLEASLRRRREATQLRVRDWMRARRP